MIQSSTRFLAARIGTIAAAALFVAACAQMPKPVTLTDVVEATATVEAIDPATRMVRMRGANGRPMAIQAGPGVQNFNQIKVGDRLTVRYTEAIAAEVVKPGTGVTSSTPNVTTGRADAGQAPGVSGSASAKGVVKVLGVDAATNTVEFSGADGTPRKIRVTDAKAQEFVRGLKVGDEVQLTFTEAIAVGFQPAR